MARCTAKATGRHRSAREAAKCPEHGAKRTPAASRTVPQPAPTPSQPRLEELFYPNGRVKSETWLLGDTVHREDGPAEILYGPDGGVEIERWYFMGRVHREDGPARILYYVGGNVRMQQWVRHGEAHREDGPGQVFFTPDGSIQSRGWYLAGDTQPVTPHHVLAPSWGVSRDNAPAIAYLEGFDCEELSAEHPAVTLALATHKNP